MLPATASTKRLFIAQIVQSARPSSAGLVSL
jgi:hypothetical protein